MSYVCPPTAGWHSLLHAEPSRGSPAVRIQVDTFDQQYRTEDCRAPVTSSAAG